MKKRYSVRGICTCQPWKDTSFILFSGFYSMDKKDEIKYCPWCGNSLIRKLDESNEQE